MGRRVMLLAAAAALLSPAQAGAVDHVTLSISPTSLASPPSPLAAWSLSAAVVAAASPGGRETFGITLSRTYEDGRVQELHGFRAAPVSSVAFDGRDGRWRARFGGVLSIAMTLTATGPAQATSESQGCRGALLSVPVALRGTFALRTGTGLFGTIRRARLAGSVTYNPGGPVDCAPRQAAGCTPSTVLTVVRGGVGLPAATLLVSPDAGGWLSASFAESVASAPSASWFHVVRVERLGAAPLDGALPAVGVRLRAGFPVAVNGTFTGPQATAEPRGACRRLEAAGTFVGNMRARFAGWGVRTATFGAQDVARYAEGSP